MGRRNINTTKSGKYMNPTDQARKEARKKELKKNKRQRQAVRAAVLKGKDPTQLIVEMEKMDQMEYNVEIPPALSEKVLKDKRKKLRETLDRVLKLYEKENPEYWVEIRRMVADYEKKRLTLIEYYEAVKHAQAVTVDEIPLPNLDMPAMAEDGTDQFDGIEMTATHHFTDPGMEAVVGSLPQPHSILKKQHQLSSDLFPPQLAPVIKIPPGCPPMLPPELSDDEDYEQPMETDPPAKQRKIRFQDDPDGKNDYSGDEKEDERKQDSDREDEKGADSDDSYSGDKKESNDDATSQKSQGLTSLQAKLLRLSGQDVDQFVRESEALLQEKEADKRAELKERLSRLKEREQGSSSRLLSRAPNYLASLSTVGSSSETRTASNINGPPGESPVPVVPSTVPPGSATYSIVPPVGVPPVGVPPVGVSSPAMSGLPMFRPPPRPGMPPPPMGVRLPPGPPPQNLPQLLPQSLPRLPNMRLPPPMRPPGVMVPPGILPRAPPPGGANLLSAAPNVLSAAPQLLPRPARHAGSAPTATIQAKPQIRSLSADVTRFLPTALRVKREDKKKQAKNTTDGKDPQGRQEGPKKPTKDDAYSQFMREMEDLL